MKLATKLKSTTRGAWVAIQVLLWGALLGFLGLLVVPHVSHLDVLIVRGGSMEPTIHSGSAEVINRSATSVSVGDIAAFHDPSGQLVTHRVISVTADGISTQGDANKSADPIIRQRASVDGRVVFAIPLVGYVLYVLQQPIAFLLLLGVTGGFVVFGESKIVWREGKKLVHRQSSGHESAGEAR